MSVLLSQAARLNMAITDSLREAAFDLIRLVQQAFISRPRLSAGPGEKPGSGRS